MDNKKQNWFSRLFGGGKQSQNLADAQVTQPAARSMERPNQSALETMAAAGAATTCRPSLPKRMSNFLTLHTSAGGAKPQWTEDDFTGLLQTLSHPGYGWPRPEGVRRELEKMAAEWQGLLPLV